MNKKVKDTIHASKLADSTPEQRQEFLSLFHQEEVEFSLKDNLLEELDLTTDSPESRQYFDIIFEKMWRKRKIKTGNSTISRRLVVRVIQIAAILVIGLLVGAYLGLNKYETDSVFYTSTTPKGSVSQMLLPDGTQIYLNSGSEIKYSVEGKNNMREIFLDGEAWFHVSKMKDKPFLVHTAMYDVFVTGTSFNVKAYREEKDVTTTLEEGNISIRSSGNLKLSGDILLKAGEQLVYDKESRNIEIHEVNTKWYSSWKGNKLEFVNMSLKELAVLLERRYGVDIEIADKDILDYHYDGTFKDETILEVLEVLKCTLPIQYHIVNQKIVIQKNSKKAL